MIIVTYLLFFIDKLYWSFPPAGALYHGPLQDTGVRYLQKMCIFRIEPTTSLS